MSDGATQRTVVVAGAESTDMGGIPSALESATGFDIVVTSVDGQPAAAQLAAADALVVADSPPESDGIEVFRRVREDGATLPVALVASSSDPDRVEAALAAGVTEYLGGWTDDRAAELGARLRAHITTPALDGAAQADRWQSIASGLAHDAKNPLNVVTGRLELLDVDATHGEAIRRSIGRVESLLDELSTVASVAGPIDDVEPVELAELAPTIWGELGAPDAALRVETGRTVEADPDSLRLVLERLFENALLHGGTDVTVTVGETERGFYVADDGPGIAPEDEGKIFQQGYGTARDGEGYGLFVARSVAAAHGWDLVAGTSEAGGARFDIRPR